MCWRSQALRGLLVLVVSRHWCGRGWERQSEFPPRASLIVPIKRVEQLLPQRPLADRLLPGWNLEEEDLLLYVRGQQQQLHDLGDASASESKVARHRGKVGELTAVDPAL
jgi:hypothetical protein